MSDNVFRDGVNKFLRCQNGTVAVEYGIIATAMFLALIPSFLYVASGMNLKFMSLTDFFNGLG
jgi:Flp pilus assembly pilin Flp